MYLGLWRDENGGLAPIASSWQPLNTPLALTGILLK